MKTIGVIGGMSWESTLEYYKILNQTVKSRLGGFHSCHLILESLNFADIERLQHDNDWERLKSIMSDAAINLQNAGADLLVLATNTMHLCADAITKRVDIPFIHIAEATGAEIRNDGIQKVLLLGTRFTMESGLYSDLLKNQFQIDVVQPSLEDRKEIHNIIYKELVQGEFLDQSKTLFKEVIRKSQAMGAEGVILGCTEIPLLIQQKDVSIRVYDTTKIHCKTAVESALSDN
jgi:aspartate racemase